MSVLHARLNTFIHKYIHRRENIFSIMGICCVGNRPSEKFVGSWTDDKHVQLNIDENGRIQYRKQVGLNQSIRIVFRKRFLE